MNGKLMLYIDQYGQPIWARTVRELRSKCGGGRVFKIYCDRSNPPRTVQVGVGVGSRWFNRYIPWEGKHHD
jgi:hypothetical protein